MCQQHPYPWDPHQFPDAFDMLHRRCWVLMNTPNVVLVREACLSPQYTPVVRAVPGQVDPRAIRRRSRENVDMSGNVSRRVDDVQAPVPVEIVGMRERPERRPRTRVQEARPLGGHVDGVDGLVKVGPVRVDGGLGVHTEEERGVWEQRRVASVVEVDVREADVLDLLRGETAARERRAEVRLAFHDDAHPSERRARAGRDLDGVGVHPEVEDEGSVGDGVFEEEDEVGKIDALARGRGVDELVEIHVDAATLERGDSAVCLIGCGRWKTHGLRYM